MTSFQSVFAMNCVNALVNAIVNALATAQAGACAVIRRKTTFFRRNEGGESEWKYPCENAVEDIKLKKIMILLAFTIIFSVHAAYPQYISCAEKDGESPTVGEFCHDDFDLQASAISLWIGACTAHEVIERIPDNEGMKTMSDIYNCLAEICNKGGAHFNLGDAAVGCISLARKKHPWLGQRQVNE